jgi:hypothetical protein
VGRVSRTNDVSDIEHVLSFRKNDFVQQNVFFSDIEENTNLGT